MCTRDRWDFVVAPESGYPVVNFGTFIPTGRTEAPRFRPELEDGSLVPISRLQRGSGTVDPLVGAHTGRRFGKATVFGSVAARISSI